VSAPAIRFFDRELRAAKRHLDGSHRTQAPARTLRRARRLMAPLGITRLADLTGLDSIGIPVFTAVRPNGKALSTSQGKGLAADAAAASALMESIETWHAENVALPRRHRGARDFAAGEAIDVGRLPRNRRIDRAARRAWVEGWDLLAGRPRWVPLEAVTLDTTFAADRAPDFDVSSNGLASGNHLLEAIVHGLCEVIERDAEARWRASRGRRRIDLAGVRDPGCRALLARFAAAGVFVAAFDLTSDLGVPVIGAMAMEDPGEPAWRALGLYQGFGCHLDPAIALGRALTEAAQTRVTYIAGSRDDFFPFDYDRATAPEVLAPIWAELHAPVARRDRVELASLPTLAGPSFEADLARLLERLGRGGVRQCVAVDLSRAEHGVPVVKVLVPGRATAIHLMG
jgi:ribosomal protein S12 methylthiotransferase accessory factor